MRKTIFHLTLLLCVWAFGNSRASAQEPQAVLLRGAKVYTMAGDRPVVDRADVWVQSGKIAAIAPQLAAPKGARVVEAGGWVIVPGLVDAKTPLLLEGTTREDNGGSADLRMLDAVDRFDRHAARETLARGVTTVCLDRFVNNSVLGRAAIVKLDGDRNVVSEAGVLSLRMDRGNDWPSKKREADAITKAFEDAKKHLEKKDEYTKDRKEFDEKFVDWKKKAAKAKKDGKEFKTKPPRVPKTVDESLADDVFLAALRGEVVVRAVVQDDQDLQLALELRDAYSLRMILDDTAQCVVSDEALGKASVPCVLYGNALVAPVERALEPLYRGDHVKRLVDAGVPVAISGGAQGTQRSRHLLSMAAETVAQGVSELDALRAITIWPARALGIEERIGSLEPGKDADLVVLTGDPLSSRSRVQMVLVDGRIVFDAAQ